MEDLIQKIVLDVDKKTSFKYVYAKQGDNGSRFVNVELVKNGKSITFDNDVTAIIRAKKPDGNSAVNDATVNDDNTITAELTEQILAVKGIVDADISVRNASGKTLSSASFKIEVDEAPVGKNVASSNEFLLLNKIINDASETIKKVNDTTEHLLQMKEDGDFNGSTGPQGPPGKDAVTDTELSVESNNAIANSAVAKVLGNGTLIGFAKVDSLEDFEELSSRYPEGIPENAFLILYVTQDLSYTDPDTQFTFPPGLYLLTQQGEIRLCPDAESVNAHFKSIDELMSNWYTIVGLKANVSDLNKVKQDLEETTDTADEALTVARGRNRALCFFTKQELDNWLNGDFQREDGKTKADLQTGDNLYIVEVGVPDYWWDGEQIRPLETQKVDLSEYAKKDYVNEKVEQEVSVPNSDIANYLEVADILGIWKNATAGRTSFANLFENANVKTIPLIDTSSGTNFDRMFYGCTKLESVPLFDTSNGTSIFNMFNGCSNLKSVPLFNTSKVTRFGGAFYGCALLTEIPNIDTSAALEYNYTFSGCSKLVTAPTINCTNLTRVENLEGTFRYCYALESVKFTANSIKFSLSMSNCSKLDSDSVASIFAGLADLTDSDAQTLTLHKDVQITQAQADAAVAKNWNIVGGTVNG